LILVDTSVLIDFFRDRVGDHVEKFDFLLARGMGFGITFFTYQELLQGSKSQADFARLKTYLDSQIFYELKRGRASYADAAYLYHRARQKGYTIRSTIDSLIAQVSIENNLLLLHNDRDFDVLSKIEPRLKFF